MKAGSFSASKEETYVILAAAGVLLWLVLSGVKRVADTAIDGAKAVTGAAADVAVGVVGAVGAAAGLPTPTQTLSDPLQVRWIIDNVGSFVASKWATADAYIAALWMPPGAGDRYPPDGRILAALGVAPSVPVPVTQGSVIDYTTGAGSVPGFGGPSFSDVASGKTDPYNPLQGLGR
jgi:hypothetical protein